MSKGISATFILLIAVVMAPASVDAQQHEHEAAEAQESMSTHMMAYMPQRLLAMQESLELSEDQRSRLLEMAEAASEHSHRHMEQMMAHGRQACDMLSGDSPNWAAYEEQVEAMAARMASDHVSMMRTAVEARSVLSPDQIETAGTATGMHGMQREEADHAMREGGGMKGSMMEGGMMQMMNGMCMGGMG